MDNLKPCGCGATPETLLISDGSTYRWRYISGSCCGEWEHECRVPTVGDNATPEGVEAACVKAWNDLPRPTADHIAAHAEVVEAAKGVIESARLWSSQDYPTFDRIELEVTEALATALAKLEEVGE